MPRTSTTPHLPFIVERPSALLPQTTQTPYFTVTGRILLTQIVGEVSVVIAGVANNATLISVPTVGAPVDLCGAQAVTAAVLGTFYNITGTLADNMVGTASGAVIAQANAILVTDGTIDLDCTANNTGETKWTLHYIPLDSGSSVAIA